MREKVTAYSKMMRVLGLYVVYCVGAVVSSGWSVTSLSTGGTVSALSDATGTAMESETGRSKETDSLFSGRSSSSSLSAVFSVTLPSSDWSVASVPGVVDVAGVKGGSSAGGGFLPSSSVGSDWGSVFSPSVGVDSAAAVLPIMLF